METLKVSSGEQNNTVNAEQNSEPEIQPFNEEEARKAVEARREEIANKETIKQEELLARIDGLKSLEVPEGKFRLPTECYDEVVELIKEASSATGSRDSLMKRAKWKIDTLEKLEGTIDKSIGEKLWSLYNDPDISIGIHGTVAEADSNFGTERSPVFVDGLGCGYGDTRRTVSFQDRGYIHGHGNISFPSLLSYDHPSSLQRQPLTVEKIVRREEKTDYGTHIAARTHWDKVEVPAKQYSVIVAIPKTVETTDPALRGKEIIVKNNNPFKEGKDKKAKVIKSEFIVGVISDSDPDTIVWNPSFNLERVKEFGHQSELEMQEEKLKQQEEKMKQQEQQEQQNTTPEKSSWISKLFGRFK